MKRVLSLVLALVMVLGMIPMGFAADQTAGEILKGYELLAGDENGDLQEDQYLNRAEMMVILARMNGKYEEAKSFALPSSYNDLAGFGWAVPYIAYAELNEWTSGVGAGKFDPAGHVTLQMAAYFMVEALGYADPADFSWTTAVEKATSLGLLAGIQANAGDHILRGDLFKVMLQTLNTNVKGKAVLLGSELGVKGFVLPVPAQLAVSSVTAINGVQFQVVFNKDVDEATAEGNNYKIVKNDGTELYYKTPVLKSDDKTVVITMEDPLHDEGKSAVVTFTVFANVIQAEGESSEVAALYNAVITVKDEVAPTITKIEAETNDETIETVVVTFSEPVQGGVYRFNGVSKSGVANTDQTKLTFTGLDLDSDLTHTFSVVNVTDPVGNITATASMTFKATVDATAPKVETLEQYSDNAILVTFNKEMDATTVIADNISVRDEVLAELTIDEVVADPNDDDGVKFIIKLDVPTLYDNKSSRSLTVLFEDEQLTDYLGNEMEAVTKSVTLKEDTTAPSLVNVRVLKNSDGDETGLELEYNEAIAAGFYSSNITVINKDGVNVSTGFFDANSLEVKLGDKKVTFTFADDSGLSGEYTFTFAKGLVTDDSVAENDSPLVKKVIDFGAGSTSTFKLDAVGEGVVVAETNEDQIVVYFGEEVKGGNVVGSATDISNYSLEGVDLSSAIISLNVLKDTATIDISDAKVNKDDDTAVFTIVNVKNADGVTIKPYTTTMQVWDNVAPVLTSARVLSTSEIELTFNEDMAIDTDMNVAGEFQIKLSGTTLTVTDMSVAYVTGYPKKVKLTLNDAVLNLSKSITIKTINVTPNTVTDDSINNNEMKGDVTVTVTKP